MIDLNEIFQDVKTEKIGQLLNETKESKDVYGILFALWME